VAEQEAQQRIVGLVPMAEDFAARDDRRARAQQRALHRHVLQPRRPALERRVPGTGKPLRPRPRAQLVERLEALPDPLGRHLDDARRGERGDEAALERGRDRIAARRCVEEGREGEERVVVLGLGRGVRDHGGGLTGDLAGGFGHLSPVTVTGGFSSVIARSRRRRGEACCPKDNPDKALSAALDCFAALAMTGGGSGAQYPGDAQSEGIAPSWRAPRREDVAGSVGRGWSMTHPKMHIPAR